jgi:hypothetical protein
MKRHVSLENPRWTLVILKSHTKVQSPAGNKSFNLSIRPRAHRAPCEQPPCLAHRVFWRPAPCQARRGGRHACEWASLIPGRGASLIPRARCLAHRVFWRPAPCQARRGGRHACEWASLIPRGASLIPRARCHHKFQRLIPGSHVWTCSLLHFALQLVV